MNPNAITKKLNDIFEPYGLCIANNLRRLHNICPESNLSENENSEKVEEGLILLRIDEVRMRNKAVAKRSSDLYLDVWSCTLLRRFIKSLQSTIKCSAVLKDETD